MFELSHTTSAEPARLPAAGSAEPFIASGRTLLRQHRAAEALARFEQALVIAPQHATAGFLRGEALFLMRDIEGALASYRRAMDLGLAQEPTAFQAAMSGAVTGDFGWFAAMLLGRFEEAWQISDRTLRHRLAAGDEQAGLPRHLRPVWRGETLAGKTVLVRCHHGLGDAIQFIRYMPLLRREAAAVIIQAQRELLPLFATVPGIDRLVPLDEGREPAHEVDIEISELMHALRTTPEAIPADLPYLVAPPERIMAERHRLRRRIALKTPGLKSRGLQSRGSKAGGFRVGLVWAGGAWRPERNLTPVSMAGLAAIPGVVLINLQRGPDSERLKIDGAPAMVDAERASLDIVETAAIIHNLDLVITVDTMVAHLAGALGAPVWLLLHHASDWRWLLAGDRSPWYPAMRLFRQPAPGDWTAVLAEVAERLALAVAGKNPVMAGKAEHLP